MTRRRFVQSSLSLLALAAAGSPAAAPVSGATRPRPRRILVLGGTGFLGPAVVEAARARGHALTLFNRGKRPGARAGGRGRSGAARRRPRPGGVPRRRDRAGGDRVLQRGGTGGADRDARAARGGPAGRRLEGEARLDPCLVPEDPGVSPWTDLPAWLPAGEPGSGIVAVSNALARAKGLAFRSIAETSRDTLSWWRTLPDDRRAKLRAGLSPERESAVLAAWRARQAEVGR